MAYPRADRHIAPCLVAKNSCLLLTTSRRSLLAGAALSAHADPLLDPRAPSAHFFLGLGIVGKLGRVAALAVLFECPEQVPACVSHVLRSAATYLRSCGLTPAPLRASDERRNMAPQSSPTAETHDEFSARFRRVLLIASRNALGVSTRPALSARARGGGARTPGWRHGARRHARCEPARAPLWCTQRGTRARRNSHHGRGAATPSAARRSLGT